MLDLAALRADVLKREHARIERKNAIEKLDAQRIAIQQETSAGGLMMFIAIARIDICSGGLGMLEKIAWLDDGQDRYGFAKFDGIWRVPVSFIDCGCREHFPSRDFRDTLTLLAKALGVPGSEGFAALHSCFAFLREGNFSLLGDVFDRIPLHAVQAILIEGSSLGEQMGVTDLQGYVAAIFDWFVKRGIDPTALAPAVTAHFRQAKAIYGEGGDLNDDDDHSDDDDFSDDLNAYASQRFPFTSRDRILGTYADGDLAKLAETTKRNLRKEPPSAEIFHEALMRQPIVYVVALIAAGADPHSKLEDGNNAYHSVASRWSTGGDYGYELFQLLAELGVKAEPNAKGLYPYYAMSMRDTWRDKEKFQKARDLVVELQELAKPTEEEAEPTPLKKPAFFSLLRGKGETA